MGQDTRELWSKRVERWKDSGLSARDFATEMGINPQTLTFWRWKLRQKVDKTVARSKPVRFVEVTPAVVESEVAPKAPAVSEPDTEGRPEPLEVVLRDEVRIRVPVRFDSETLRRVVTVLGTC